MLVGMLCRSQIAPNVVPVLVAVWLTVPVPVPEPDAVLLPVADAVSPVSETPVPVPVMVSAGAVNSPSSDVGVAGASLGGFSGGAGILAQAAALLDTALLEIGLVLDWKVLG